MNMSQHYYLKEGRLELNMLDDEEDEKEIKESFKENEVSSQRNAEDSNENAFLGESDDLQPTLQVSQEVYNTLHVMGQYLTKVDEKEYLNNVEGENNLDEKSVNDPIAGIESDEVLIPHMESEWNKELEEEDYKIKQKGIDELVESFFVSTENKQPPNEFMAELKRHIDKQIEAIMNYE